MLDCQWLSDWFSLYIAFRSEIDALTIVNYAGVALFDLGIFSLYYIFKFWNARKAKQSSDKDQMTPSPTITVSYNQSDDVAEKGLSTCPENNNTTDHPSTKQHS